jgi:hypothetical protein
MRFDAARANHHIADLLPAYVNETLDALDAERVRYHLATCAACRDELAFWRTVAGTAWVTLAPSAVQAPSLALLDGVWQRLDASERERASALRALWRRASWAGQVLRAQVPLVPKGIWIASATVMLLTFIIMSAWAAGSLPYLLGFIAAPVMAAGCAFIYGPDHDPALEVTLATPVSPRLVLLGRLALVFGYNVCLTLCVTLLVVLTRGASFGVLVSYWLGPLLLLTGLSLLLSATLGTVAGIAGPAGLWCLRFLLSVLMTTNGQPAVDEAAFAAIWQTNPTTLAIAAVLLIAAVLYAPRRARTA